MENPRFQDAHAVGTPAPEAGTQVFLGLGSNVDREKNLCAALEALALRLFDMRCSQVYASEAVGCPAPYYFNLVVSARIDMPLASLLGWLKTIETRGGRRPGSNHDCVSVDIDVLLYGGLVGCPDGLELPRREVLEQAFVLRPLSKIAPQHLHPATGISFAAHWQAMKGANKSRLWLVELPWDGPWKSSAGREGGPEAVAGQI